MRLPTACINYCQIQHQRCCFHHHTVTHHSMISLPKSRQKKSLTAKSDMHLISNVLLDFLTFEMPEFWHQKIRESKVRLNSFTNGIPKFIEMLFCIFAPEIIRCNFGQFLAKNWVSYPWWAMKHCKHFCPLCIVKFKKLHQN